MDEDNSPSLPAQKILGIAGSLRQASYNRAALRAAQELAPEGCALEVFNLAGIPPFNQDEEGSPPASVVELKAAVREADAILLVTPEYNYSIPGVLKNAIDWASRPYGDSAWEGKPVAVMGASVGAHGSARAQYHLRQCFVFLNMHAVNRPEVMIANASEKFDGQGKLTDEKARKLIRHLLEALVALANSRVNQLSANLRHVRRISPTFSCQARFRSSGLGVTAPGWPSSAGDGNAQLN